MLRFDFCAVFLLLSIFNFLKKSCCSLIFVSYITEFEGCRKSGDCDGSASKPFFSLAEALWMCYQSSNDSVLILNDNTFTVTEAETVYYKSRFQKNDLAFDEKYSQVINISVLGGGSNESNDKRTKIIFLGGIITFVAKNYNLFFSNIDFIMKSPNNYFSKINNFITIGRGISKGQVVMSNVSVYLEKIDKSNTNNTNCLFFIDKAFYTILLSNFLIDVQGKNTFDKFFCQTKGNNNYIDPKNGMTIVFNNSVFSGKGEEVIFSLELENINLEIYSSVFLENYKFYSFIVNSSRLFIQRTTFNSFYSKTDHLDFKNFIEINNCTLELANAYLRGVPLDKDLTSLTLTFNFMKVNNFSIVKLRKVYIQNIYLGTVISLFANMKLIGLLFSKGNISVLNVSRRVFQVRDNNEFILEGGIFFKCQNDLDGSTDRGGSVAIFNSANNIKIRDAVCVQNTAESGGAIYFGMDGVVILMNNHFLLNNARSRGGGIFVSGPFLSFRIIANLFLSNRASMGGSVLFSNSVSNFLSLQSLFINNSAKNDGGAFCFLKNTSAIIYADSVFISNSGTSGGAISLTSFNTIFLRCVFASNSAQNGGSLYSSISSNSTFIFQSTFYQNSASLYGGAIFFGNGNSNINIISSIFAGNIVKTRGGGIWFGSGLANAFISDTTALDCFSSSEGGFLFVGSNDTNFHLLFNLAISNIAKASSGSYFFSDLNLTNTIFKGCILSGNWAKSIGSTFFIGRLSLRLTFLSCFFLNNTSDESSSAAVHLSTNSVITIISDCIFLSNRAGAYGGAVGGNYNCETFLIYNCSFIKNNALFGGGFNLNSNNNNVYLIKLLFKLNEANLEGGAIYLNYFNNTNVYLIYCDLEENNAKFDGGSLYLKTTNYNISVEKCLFSRNSAFQGGDIFMRNENVLTVKESKFIGSEGKIGALLVSLETNTISFQHSTFKEFSNIIGTIFCMGPKSDSTINSSIFETFRPNFKNSAIFRIYGLKSDLKLESTKFNEVFDYILDDFAFEKAISVEHCYFLFSNNYRQAEIFNLNLQGSSILFLKNIFKMDAEVIATFIYSKQIASNLTIKDTIIIQKSLRTLIMLLENSFNQIILERLTLRLTIGTLIEVAKLTNSKLNMNVLDCKFFVRNSLSHYFYFQSGSYLALKKTVFFIHISQLYSLIYDQGSEASDLLINDCEFKDLKLNRTEQLQAQENSNKATNFALIQSVGALKSILIANSLFMMGDKLFNSILSLEDSRIILIKGSMFITNILKPVSYFFLIKFQKEVLFNISYCNIKFNRVVFGGLLALMGLSASADANYNSFPPPSITISNSDIVSNKAVNRGGLIYINTTYLDLSQEKNLHLLFKAINFSNNTVKKNNAPVSNIIYFDGPHVYNSSITIILKYISNFVNPKWWREPSIGSSLKNLLFSSLDNEKLQENKNYFLDSKIMNKKDKPLKFYFCFVAVDQYDNLITAPSENNFNASISKSPIIPFLDFNDSKLFINFTFFRSSFCVYRFYFSNNFQGLLGTKYTLIIDSQKFGKYFQIFNTSNLPSYRIDFEIEDCNAGQFFNGEYCVSCPRGTYYDKKIIGSLSLCYPCTELKNYFCYGGNMRSPKRNYWRYDNETKDFLRCPNANCLGDVDYDRNVSWAECENCFLPTSNQELLVFSFYDKSSAIGYCKRGYKGALCSECLGNFGKTQRYRCGDCEAGNVYFKEAIALILKLFLFFYSNWKALKNKVLDSTNFEAESLNNSIKSSYLLKILYVYSNYINILLSLPFELDIRVLDIFSFWTSVLPSESFDIFSFECILRIFRITLAPIYCSALLNVAFVTFTFIGFTLAIIKKKEPKFKLSDYIKNFRSYFIGIIIILCMDNIVLSLTPLFRIMICINIRENKMPENRLLFSLETVCWNSLHKNFVYLLVIPFCTLTVIVIPLYILVNLFKAKKRNKINDEAFLEKFGYFTAPYNDRMFFYELIKISNKIIIILFNELFILFVILNSQLFISLVLLFYLMLIHLIQTFANPYKSDKFRILQKTDYYSSKINISNTLVAILWGLLEEIYLSDSLALLKFLLSFYIILSNGLFLYLWFQSYFGFLRLKLSLLFLYFKKRAAKIIRAFNHMRGIKGVPLLAHLSNNKDHDAKQKRTKQRKMTKKSFLLKEISHLKMVNRLLLNHIKKLQFKNEENLEENECSLLGDKIKQLNTRSRELTISKPSNDPIITSEMQFKNACNQGQALAKLKSKKVKGESESTYYLRLKFKIEKDLLTEDRKFEVVLSVNDNDWVASLVRKDGYLITALRKMTSWTENIIEKQLKLMFNIIDVPSRKSKNRHSPKRQSNPYPSNRLCNKNKNSLVRPYSNEFCSEISLKVSDFLIIKSFDWKEVAKEDPRTLFSSEILNCSRVELASKLQGYSRSILGNVLFHLPVSNIEEIHIRLHLNSGTLRYENILNQFFGPELRNSIIESLMERIL